MFPVTINLFLSCYLVYTVGPVHGRIYTAVPCRPTGPCRWPVTYAAVYTARKARPCLRPVHSSVHDCVHDRADEGVHGRVRAV